VGLPRPAGFEDGLVLNLEAGLVPMRASPRASRLGRDRMATGGTGTLDGAEGHVKIHNVNSEGTFVA
jgi:hypothetical protein